MVQLLFFFCFFFVNLPMQKKGMKKLNIDCLRSVFYQMDRNSLHSCLLVNREWCKIIVPILWKIYPWCEYHSEKFGKLLDTILSCLPSSSKQLLSDNDIKLPSTVLSQSPLLNYISFCKFPDPIIIRRIIKILFKEDQKSDRKSVV